MTQSIQLNETYALVTGASTGLGRAMAHEQHTRLLDWLA